MRNVAINFEEKFQTYNLKDFSVEFTGEFIKLQAKSVKSAVQEWPKSQMVRLDWITRYSSHEGFETKIFEIRIFSWRILK